MGTNCDLDPNKPKMAYSRDAFTRDFLEIRERLERDKRETGERKERVKRDIF